MMKNYKLIGFDMDGTLCHPKTNFEQVFQLAFGLELAEVRDVWASAIMADGARTGIEAIQAIFPKATQAEADEHLLNFSNLWAQEQQLFNGVLPMLKDLKQNGHKLVLITNGPSFMQHAVIEQLGIGKYFNKTFASGDEALAINKPNKSCFDKVVQIMNVEAENCLFIGDGKVNDYQGAIGAGWDAIWVNPTNQKTAQAFEKIEPSENQAIPILVKWA